MSGHALRRRSSIGPELPSPTGQAAGSNPADGADAGWWLVPTFMSAAYSADILYCRSSADAEQRASTPRVAGSNPAGSVNSGVVQTVSTPGFDPGNPGSDPGTAAIAVSYNGQYIRL